MVWFVVGTLMAIGTATIALLLTRIERVRIQPGGEPVGASSPVSAGRRQG